jgi:transposase-like protein
MLAAALEVEVAQYFDQNESERAEEGRRLVVRNGRARPRKEIDRFEAAHGAKYPKAVTSLRRDQDKLLAFCDFPAEH